tara:strand:- start:1432 stop:2259 length:828 start_codon:yes stop_codon:yes gene_type:complete
MTDGTDLVVETVEVVGDMSDIVLPAELDRAVATAKEYPRSIEVARKSLYELTTLDTESAQLMFYGLKRGGKRIEGPSIRFAECVMNAWGNLRVYGRGIEAGATLLVAEGYAWDLQTNTAVGKRVSRRITKRDGSRYSDDMIAVAENAAVSIAIRNAILSIVPRPLYREAYEAAVKTSAGDTKTIKQRRSDWLVWWSEQGGKSDQMWDYLGIKGPDDIGGFELRALYGLRTSIDEGMTSFLREMSLLKSPAIPEERAAAFDAAVMLTPETTPTVQA